MKNFSVMAMNMQLNVNFAFWVVGKEPKIYVTRTNFLTDPLALGKRRESYAVSSNYVITFKRWYKDH
jgi:hypothetical protein